MGRPRKVLALKDDEVAITDKQDLLDIIADAVQAHCGVPGCKGKFHYPEAQVIINRLRDRNLLKETGE